ncbi:MAG: S-layer homology domain-containing protein, partial [Candidatus Fimenecus sp.]|nr:S-layer homology domain-containing protein [Candidatus Fimenecus sp.]
DVPSNAYYSAAVAWAKDRGIVTGYSADNFGVGTYISREQICLILSRYFDGEATGDVDAIVQAYPDGGNTSPWAKAGVAWAIENGIVGNAGYINPIGNAGRAEVAQIIYNMANKGMI